MIWFAAATAVFGFFTRPAWVTLTLAGLATATSGGIGPAWIGASAFGLDDDEIGPRLVIAAGTSGVVGPQRQLADGSRRGGVRRAVGVHRSHVRARAGALRCRRTGRRAEKNPFCIGGVVLVTTTLVLTYEGYVPWSWLVLGWSTTIFIAAGAAVLLVVAAPRPTWVALAIAAFAALATYTATTGTAMLGDVCSRPGVTLRDPAGLVHRRGQAPVPGDGGIRGRG